MTTVGPAAPPTNRYAALTLVRDGDGYILGSRRSPSFFAVPDIGGQIVIWLQQGSTVEVCTRRAGELAGEAVDVAAFLDGLVQAGILADDAVDHDVAGPAPLAGWKHALGRVVLGPVGLSIQGLLLLAGAAAIVAVPRMRPHYTDALVSRAPLISMLLVAVFGIAFGLAHECAHVLGAWSVGVPSRVSISRRMVSIVYQTDLTRLWSVPPRRRVVPLIAGMLFDGATIGAVVIAELTILRGVPPVVTLFARLIVFRNVSGIVFQFMIFMRTDVYALFVLATRTKHLWDTKGALARAAIRRATVEDRALLSTVDRRERRWAAVFLCLYLPGVAWTAWYFTTFAVPVLVRITTMAFRTMVADGVDSVSGATGAIALVLAVASTTYLVWGLGRTIVRLGRRVRSGA